MFLIYKIFIICVCISNVVFSASIESEIIVSELKIFPDLPVVFNNTNNNLCNEDNELFADSLNNLTLWAYQMWESNAHTPPVGMLIGNTHQLGHFDECLATKSPFQVQYCLAEIEVQIKAIQRDKFSNNYNPNDTAFSKLYFTGDISRIPRNVVNLALCIPASCSSKDVEDVLSRHLQKLNANNTHNLKYSAKVIPDLCQTNRQDESFGAADVCFCLLMIILLLLVIVCTIYDLKVRDEVIAKAYKKPLMERLMLCFSAKRNFEDLPKRDDSNPALNILYGMRTFAIMMIIIDHRCGTFISTPVFNREFVENQFRSFASLFIFHGDLFVDSFFVLSGLLVTYSLLVSFEKRITASWLIIFNRYVRLTPIYAVVIFFYATLLYKTGSGPLWHVIVGGMQSDCQSNWWASLLYLSNYVNDDHMCMVHSWYLPCDFHYFILAIPTILLLRKRPQTGLFVISMAFILALIVPFAITIYYQRPALLHFYVEFLTAPKTHPDFRLTYTKSHTRAAAYLIGMFTGYAYYKLRNSTIKLSLVKSTALTLLGLVLMLGGMTSGGIFYNPYYEYNSVEAALYAGLHRPAWALGSAILLLNTSYGRFGLMKTFLEWEPWIPLSKLVYGAYLVHMCWQLRSAAMAKSPRHLDQLSIVTMALGDIVLSFSLALLLYMLVEAPFRKVFRELMGLKNRVRKEEKPEIILGVRTIENGTENSHL